MDQELRHIISAIYFGLEVSASYVEINGCISSSVRCVVRGDRRGSYKEFIIGHRFFKVLFAAMPILFLTKTTRHYCCGPMPTISDSSHILLHVYRYIIYAAAIIFIV